MIFLEMLYKILIFFIAIMMMIMVNDAQVLHDAGCETSDDCFFFEFCNINTNLCEIISQKRISR